MRRPSARMTPNTVTLRTAAFARDIAAGRLAQETAGLRQYRCAVQPRSMEDVEEHSREQGVQYLTVKFYEDPGLRVRDSIVDEAGRELVVTGVRGPSGGARRTWPVDCEYRPPPG